jgi:uncharacterized protein DUF5709
MPPPPADPVGDSEDPAEDDGVLDPSDSLTTDDLAADVLDTGVDAGEAYRGATRYGTTLAEEQRGEGLDALLAEEEPEPDDDPVWTDENQPEDLGRTRQPRAGRLVDADDPDGLDAGFDADADAGLGELDLVAREAGVDGGAASAEESAVHLTDDPPFR